MLLSELQSCLRTECFMIGGVESSSLRSSYLTLSVWNQHFKSWANVVMVPAFSVVLYPKQKLHPTVWAWVEEGNPHFLGLFTYNSLSNCLYLGSEWKMLMSYPSWEDTSLWPGARERGNLVFLVAFTSCWVWRSKWRSESQYKCHRFSLFLYYFRFSWIIVSSLSMCPCDHTLRL